MKMFKLIFIIILSLIYKSTFTQTVDIFVSDLVTNFPEIPVVDTAYQNAGFTTVNITSGPVNTTLDTVNYDVAIITEFYSIAGGGTPYFLTSAQRQIVEDFILDGGHVIWIAEDGPSTPTNALTTTNNIYGTSLSYGPFFNNGGMGSPFLPKIHPSNGPGGLSVSGSLLGSGSYSTLLNVPLLSAVYTADFFDNTNFFEPCIHTTIALFPEQPVSTNGSIILSTELQVPFTSSPPFNPPFPPPPNTLNTPIFDSNVAGLHFNLITGASMTNINNWSNTSTNVNQTCIPLEAIIFASDTLICAGDSITFTDSSTGNPISWAWSFENGTPDTASTQGAHTIYFNSPGTHNITLSISDGINTDDTTIQITVNPLTIVTDSASNPSSCTLNDGSILLQGLSNTTTYTVSYIQDGVTIGPNSFTTNAVGEIDIINLPTGTYSDFVINPVGPSNLIPNPGFDQVNSCLTGFGLPLGFGINNATGWSNANFGSADAFHSCNTGNGGSRSTPSNFQGTQTPNSGDGYAGVITFENLGTVFREYAQTTLSSPLVAGKTYDIGFYASLSDQSQFATDGMAMYIGTGAINQGNQNNIPVTPQLSAGLITDFTNWTLVQGTYTATGGEDNVIFGNFFDDANTTTAPTSMGSFNRANYYLDDVFIIEVPALNCIEIGFDTIILENTYPSINAGNDTSICIGDSINLTAQNPDGAIISWNNGVVDGNTFALASTDTFIVSANLNGCIVADTVQVSVISCVPLIASFTLSDTMICVGDSITFTDSSTGNPSSWAWSFVNGTPDTASTQGAHTIFFGTAGMQNITLSISNGIVSDDTTVQIIVNPSPTIDAGNDTTICNGDSMVLSALNPDGASLTWNNSVVDGDTISPSTTNSYIVSADLAGCFAIDTIDVMVQVCLPLEANFTLSDTLICLGDSITFTDSSTGNPSSWAWSFNNGTPDTASTQGPHTIFFGIAGTHSITLSISDGVVTDDTTVQITVNPNPTINAGNDTTICNGDSMVLSALNPDGATLIWNNGVIDGNTFAPATTDTFIVSADLNGCIVADTVEVLVVNCIPLTANFGSSSDTICVGNSITFTDSSIGTNPANSWAWSFENGTPDTASTQGAHTILFGTAGLQNITLYVSNGIENHDTTFQVMVNQIPTIDAGNDTTICNGDSMILSALNPDGAMLTWNNGIVDGDTISPSTSNSYIVSADLAACVVADTIDVSVNQATSSNINASFCNATNYTLPDGIVVNTAGTYTSTLIGTNTCDSIVTTILRETSTGTFDSLQDVSLCSSFSLVLDANSNNMSSLEWFLDDGTGFSSLVGNTDYIGASTDQLTLSIDTALNSNKYRLVMTDSCGNNFSTEMTLTVNLPPVIDNPINDTTFCLRDINILSVPYAGSNFVWNTGEIGQFISPSESGTYTVSFNEQITNCLISDDIEVTIDDCLIGCKMILPTGFSPDGNAVNDKLKAFSNCKEEIVSFELLIFNRWGELVFNTTDIGFEWQGNYKNKTLEIGVYSYTMKYTIEATNKAMTDKGTITIVK